MLMTPSATSKTSRVTGLSFRGSLQHQRFHIKQNEPLIVTSDHIVICARVKQGCAWICAS